ncbi:hypothetical protein [Caldivirga sp.]|jgi:hypothetical protein|uniref:hypothetical protein n=1 Tax=Caldivirga sp. TaxID=2080243 RepID=UPI003D134FEF
MAQQRLIILRWYGSLRLYLLLSTLLALVGSYMLGYSLVLPSSYLSMLSSEAAAAASMPFLIRLINGLIALVIAYIPYAGIGWMSYNMISVGELGLVHPLQSVVQMFYLMILTVFPMVDGTLLTTVLLVSRLSKIQLPTNFMRPVLIQYSISIGVSLVLFLILISL